MAPLAPNQVITCIDEPPEINSYGIWDQGESPSILTYSLPLLQLQILIIFFTTQACHMIFKHFRLPMIFSQSLAGVILGRGVLGRYAKMREVIFTLDSQDVLGTIASLGYALFLFTMGVKMDVGMIWKIGRTAIVIGILSLVAPLLFGPSLEPVLRKTWLKNDMPPNLYVIETGLALSPFPDIFLVLTNLKILNSELGRLAISAATVTDLGSVLIVNIATFIRVSMESTELAIKSIGGTIGFVTVLFLVIRPMMHWMIKQTPKGKPIRDIYVHMIIFMVLASAVFSNAIGQYALFGPFIFGLAVPDGPPLGSATVEKLDCIVSGVLLPLFVTVAAMKAEFGTLLSNINVMIIMALLISLTLSAKVGVIVMVSYFYCNLPLKDSFTLALIMNCKGIVELANYAVSRDNQTVSGEAYTALFIAIMTTIIIANVFVLKLYGPSRIYGGYQKRNIISLKPNSELRILMCIHRPDDIPAAINFLETSSPTPETPITVSVLHLIKLVGRALPIFISHNVQSKSASVYSYSQNVIPPFNQYQRNNVGTASVNILTAVSPPSYMHEDVCTLALDKLTSLIVLPFHRNWNIDGSVASEDNNIRALNCSILERAPCSVGILVNRGQRRHAKLRHLKRIAVIYLGGRDDREALSLGKRIKRSSSSSLTVVRLVANDPKEDVNTFGRMLDNNAVKDIEHFSEIVEDGPQTAIVLRQMISQFDLFIVGRHYGIGWQQTAGLTQWSEFPELGVIGDLLASSDFNAQASILVVQQQAKLG